MQAVGRGIRNHPHADPSDPRTVGLSGDDDQGFIRLLPALGAFLQTADVGLIDLDPAAQPIPVWSDHRPSQLVQPSPSCLVTSQPEHTLQP